MEEVLILLQIKLETGISFPRKIGGETLQSLVIKNIFLKKFMNKSIKKKNQYFLKCHIRIRSSYRKE
jgi:hypothetical protein